jgi:hypothetical protein
MSKLEQTIKSKEYTDLLLKHFKDVGLRTIVDEQQKTEFRKSFSEYNINLDDRENLSLYFILMKSYWFCEIEDSNIFGLYFNPEIKEYTCIIQFDNEWNLRFRGNDIQKWVSSFFRRKEGRNIPEKVTSFLIDTSILNREIVPYPEIDEEEIFRLYK